MKVNNIKRIVAEDFDKDDQALIRKLAFAINPFIEQLVTAFNKNLDFENFNQDKVFFDTTVDVNGVPTSNSEILIQKVKPSGIQCISARSLNDNSFPTGTPFISFTINNNIIKVLHISGLPPGKPFRLGLILYP